MTTAITTPVFIGSETMSCIDFLEFGAGRIISELVKDIRVDFKVSNRCNYLAQLHKIVSPTTLAVTERKTVAQLLHELNLSDKHVVLVDGKRLTLNDYVDEDDTIIVLPLITGG